VFVFAVWVTSGTPDAAACVARATEPDSLVAEIDEVPTFAAAAAEALGALRDQPGLEGVVLVRDDVVLADPAFCASVRALLAGGDVGAVLLDGRDAAQALVLSAAAARRVDPTRSDDLVAQVRAGGERVATLVPAAPPLVSVLIPTYERPRYLAEALASALAQTHTEIEVIIGDNAGSPAIAALVDEIAAGDPRVTLVSRPVNLGFYASAIDLVERARGDYVKFLLDDDRLAPDAVARLLAPMLRDPGVVLSTSKQRAIDGEGAPLPEVPEHAALAAHDAVFDGPDVARYVLTTLVNVVGAVSAALFRRDAVTPADLWSIGGREMLAYGDIALWIGLLAQGRMAYTPAELNDLRRHPGQGTELTGTFVRGTYDFCALVDGARELGLIGPEDEERAWDVLLTHLSAHVAARASEPELRALALEGVYLALARLLELRDPAAAPPDGPLEERLHAPAALARLARPVVSPQVLAGQRQGRVDVDVDVLAPAAA
jgi:hypothetical protein